jgi:hypothetical protein
VIAVKKPLDPEVLKREAAFWKAVREAAEKSNHEFCRK